MRFSCKRSSLADVAAAAGLAVSSKSTKKIFECIRVEAIAGSAGGSLDLSGTDLEVAARYRLPGVDVKDPGVAVVPAALFSSLLREIGDETVTVVVAKQKLHLETDGGRFELECEDSAQFPEIPAFPERATGRVAAGDLRALIRKTSFAVGKEAARFVLNGVRMICEAGSLRFVATDGRRLATIARPIERGEDAPPQTVTAIVGVRGLQHFERAAAGTEGSVELAILDRSVGIRTANAEVSARVMDGSFPDHQQIIPKESKGVATVPVQVLLSRLRQVGQFASIESQAVGLSFREGELSVSAAGTDGRGEARLGVDYSGPEEKIGFNPAFLIEGLKVIDGESVRIGITNRNAAARIWDESGYQYVLMPVVIEA